MSNCLYSDQFLLKLNPNFNLFIKIKFYCSVIKKNTARPKFHRYKIKLKSLRVRLYMYKQDDEFNRIVVN